MRYLFQLLITACGCWLAVAASAAEIWVVTDQEHPVRASVGVRIIELDAPQKLQRELFGRLPRDSIEATAIAKRRLQEAGPKLQQRMAVAYEAVADALRLGVTKVPAVIVDKRFVVYGEPDVERALSWIEDYRRSHP